MNENKLYKKLITIENILPALENEDIPSVDRYADLVWEDEWQQAWDPDVRKMGESHKVRGEIWSDAIERCLAENGAVFIPKIDQPIYIDRPIVLHGRDRLVVHPETEVRLKVGAVGTCMVRNAQIISKQDGPVEMCVGANEGILIEGGIWNDQMNEGRGRGGRYDLADSITGSSGTILLHNVSRVVVRNMVFRDCSSFAVQIGNAANYVLENIIFDETADGIHVEGPSQRGIIRNLRGATGDDMVALNAWDWDNSSLTFGPISDMLIEDVEMQSGDIWSEIRYLPGTKVFSSGETLDCDVSRIICRNIRGIHTFKLYDQPNLGNPEGDYADPIGKMSDLFFSNIVVDGIPKSEYYDKSSDGVFDICNHIDGISISNVRFNYLPCQSNMAPYLVSVGPKSLTWHRRPTNESGSCWRPALEGDVDDEWVEVFNPKANPVVKGLCISDVYIPDPSKPGAYAHHEDPPALVNERHLTLNPDFPTTMPRGGTGSGKIIDPSFA
jgi:hypothetical protein